MLTQERLKELLSYDAETGEWRWRVDRGGRIRAGDIAGSDDGKGYRRIKIDYRDYAAHRLAWLYMTSAWPKRHVDHRDCNPTNNAWENLREATPSQNNANARVRSHSGTGIKGVYHNSRGKKYLSRITVEGERLSFASVDTADEAAAMYECAARLLYGEYARSA